MQLPKLDSDSLHNHHLLSDVTTLVHITSNLLVSDIFQTLLQMSPALQPMTMNGKSRLIEMANITGTSSSSALPLPSFTIILPGNQLSVLLPENPRMEIFQQLVLAVKRGNNMKR